MCLYVMNNNKRLANRARSCCCCYSPFPLETTGGTKKRTIQPLRPQPTPTQLPNVTPNIATPLLGHTIRVISARITTPFTVPTHPIIYAYHPRVGALDRFVISHSVLLTLHPLLLLLLLLLGLARLGSAWLGLAWLHGQRNCLSCSSDFSQ